MTIPVNLATKDLLVVDNLKTHFPIRAGVLQRVVAHVKAVDGVSFAIREGKPLGWWASPAVARPPWGARFCAYKRPPRGA